MQTIQNYINGELIPPVSGEYLDNFDPSTGSSYSAIADSDERDVQIAVDAAKAAFPAWSKTSTEIRHDILMRLVALIERDLEQLALAESIDQGKPLSLARTVDIPRAVSNFKFYATAAMHSANEAHDNVAQGAINYTLRQPLGVVGCISPWNLPLYLFTWKIAPAIAAGCTVVAKPSEVTPMTAYLLAKLCIEAGLPPGVLNIVQGLGVDPLAAAYPMIIGKVTGTFVCPLAPAVWLALGIANLDMGKHLRYSIFWVWGFSLVLLVVARFMGMYTF